MDRGRGRGRGRGFGGPGGPPNGNFRGRGRGRGGGPPRGRGGPMFAMAGSHHAYGLDYAAPPLSSTGYQPLPLTFDPYGGHTLGSSSSENIAPVAAMPTRGFPPRQPRGAFRGRGGRGGLGMAPVARDDAPAPMHHGGLGFATGAPAKPHDRPRVEHYRPLLQPVLFVRGDNQELHGHNDEADGVIPAKDPSPESSPLSVDAPVFTPRATAQPIAPEPEPEVPLPSSSGPPAGLRFEASSSLFVVDTQGDASLATASIARKAAFVEARPPLQPAPMADSDDEEVILIKPSGSRSVEPPVPVASTSSAPRPPSPLSLALAPRASDSEGSVGRKIRRHTNRKRDKRRSSGKAEGQRSVDPIDKAPRTGDSDVEWGDAGPPTVAMRIADQARAGKAAGLDAETIARRADRAARNAAKIEAKRARKPRGWQVEPAIVGDQPDVAGDMAVDVDVDDSTLQQFVEGVSRREHVSIDDNEVQQRLQIANDAAIAKALALTWDTAGLDTLLAATSIERPDEFDAGEEDPDATATDIEDELAAAERALIGESSDEDAPSDVELVTEVIDEVEMSDGEAVATALLSGKTVQLGFSGGRNGEKTKSGKRAVVKGSDDSSSSEEDGMFDGVVDWESDGDDDDVRSAIGANELTVQDDVDAKKFRAVVNGDFADDYDDDFSVAPKSSKGKGKAPVAPPGSDLLDASLQEQWQRDRKAKAARKIARTEMRALAQPTKANLKKAKRAKRRSGAHADDDDDEYDSDGALAKGGSNFDPVSIDIALRSFVLDVRRSAFSLPPMSKRERVVVHLLADAYSLASTSRGSGAKRFTTVNRTSRTAVYGADAKVKRILDAAYKKSGGGFGGGRGSNRYNTMLDALDGGSRTIVPVKNREGDVVGRGASALENDNAGYALLAKMGWTQGQTLGLNQSGLKTHIEAVIKTSKRGLGH